VIPRAHRTDGLAVTVLKSCPDQRQQPGSGEEPRWRWEPPV